MKWKLNKITQETNHPFLNYFTLTYEVEKDDGTVANYDYYMTSRRDKDHLLCVTHDYQHPDGVVMPLYYIHPETHEIYLLFTRQFRPAISRYVISFPAGLIDKEDKDIEEAIRREAMEETGAEITDIEMLTQPGPTSTGLSDELNCSALARIVSFGDKKLEEFEDINTKLVPLKNIHSMLNNPDEYYFPMNIQLMLKYILERFKNQI